MSDCIKKEKVYNTEEFDEFLDRCDKRMKKYFEIEKKNIEMERKYLKLKKKYDKLMTDFDDFFKFYVKKVDKEREKLYNIKYDRLFSIKQNGIINNQPSQLVKEDEMCSTSYNTGGRSNSGEWVSFDFDDSVENLQKFIEGGVGLGGFNFGYHRLEYNKPGTISKTQTKVNMGCPFDCGLCPDHDQHTCIGLIEVTNACDLCCPTCYASSTKGGKFLELKEIEKMMDFLQDSEHNNAEILQIKARVITGAVV